MSRYIAFTTLHSSTYTTRHVLTQCMTSQPTPLPRLTPSSCSPQAALHRPRRLPPSTSSRYEPTPSTRLQSPPTCRRPWGDSSPIGLHHLLPVLRECVVQGGRRPARNLCGSRARTMHHHRHPDLRPPAAPRTQRQPGHTPGPRASGLAGFCPPRVPMLPGALPPPPPPPQSPS